MQKGDIPMKTEKYAKWLRKSIEEHYACHGVGLKLRLRQIDKDSKRFLFDVRIKPGTRVDAVFNRATDVGEALGVPLLRIFREDMSIRLVASPSVTSENSLFKMLCSREFSENKAKLPVALGYDLMGRMVFDDLGQMPHAMYIGSTNSGKSTGLSTLILSLVCSRTANEVNLIILDVGGNSLQLFEGIPHLSHPIVKEHSEALYVLSELENEMTRRIALGENERCSLPAIVCVIDEYVSFIQNTRDGQQRQSIRDTISDLLRRGRGVGMHMILATQDIRKDAMGVDIDNITSRMAFKVAKYQSSINAINVGGAEKLTGKGSMLYVSANSSDPRYIQGAYMHRDEIRTLVDRSKTFNHTMNNKFVIPEMETVEASSQTNEGGAQLSISTVSKEQQELGNVVLWVLEHNAISASQIKTRFSMGNRVNGIMDKLCEMEIIAEKFANQPRKVLVESRDGIPEDVISLFKKCGFSEERISLAFNKRGCVDVLDDSEDDEEWSEALAQMTVLPS